MKTRLISTLAMLLMFISGSETMAYHVDERIDRFEGKKMIIQVRNENRCVLPPEDVAFDLGYDPDSKECILRIEYSADQWLFIEKIIFLADGKRYVFDDLRFNDEVGKKLFRKITETGVLPISIEDIRAMANSEQIECRFYGRRGVSEFTKIKHIQRRWKEFLDQYVKD